MRLLRFFVQVLGIVGMSGLFSIFIAAILYVVLSFFWWLAMIPVSIIVGDQATHQMEAISNSDWVFKVLYAIVFFSILITSLRSRKRSKKDMELRVEIG